MFVSILRARASRSLCYLLTAGQVLLSVPVAAQTAASPQTQAAKPAPAPPKVTVNRTVPAVTPPPLEPVFSASPTVEEIFHARVFPEPLVPVGAEPGASENAALARALRAFHRSGGLNWRPTLGLFLAEHPASPWRASLLANLGALHARTHAYARALASLDEAWQLAKDAPDVRGRAVADFAVGEWLMLAASFGQAEPVTERLKAIAERPIGGSAGTKVRRAREMLALVTMAEDEALSCGPEALLALLEARDGAAAPTPRVVTAYKSAPTGVSLSELEQLAGRAGLSLRAMAGDGAREVPVPAVVHWKFDHYAAVTERQGDRYRIVDRARQQTYWVDRDTLFEETSGYFLVVVCTRSMSSEYRAGGRSCSLESAVPPRRASESARAGCLKISTSARLITRSCSTCASSIHGARARHSVM